jgi:FKBP-type peptidyl-prolyl cis-trans isomerase FklB
MNKSILQIATVTLACTALISCSSKQSVTELKTQDQKVSYALGQDMGAYLKRMGITIDKAALFQGLGDTLWGGKSLMTAEELLKVKQEYTKTMQEAQAAKLKAVGEANSKEGTAFLEKNKAEKGVISTASGLQYTILKEGTGPKPKVNDMVTVHYRGTFINGKEFDNSYKRGQPATFPLSNVIPGWTEGLQLLNTGAKAKLFVPANLGYGERGAGQEIGPNATLIFEIELLVIAPNKGYSPPQVQHIK